MSDLDTYLRRLSDLGREFGIGLAGEIQTYEMVHEDHWFDYSADEGGVICLGAQGKVDGPQKAPHPVGT